MVDHVGKPLNSFVVVAADWHRPDPDPFHEDRRLLKAALLYADAVDVRRITYAIMLTRGLLAALQAMGRPPDDFGKKVRGEHTGELFSVLTRLAGHPEVVDLPAEIASHADEVYYELRLAAESGALLVPGPDHHEDDADWWRPMRDPSQIPVLQRPPQHASMRPNESPTAHPRLAEALIATSLLGQLETFPDASMDVILDVRERLKGARVNFRAAMSKAAAELSEAQLSDRELDAAIAHLRVETVEPALQAIRETLHTLGVRRTLLRLAKDKFTITSAGATVTMIAGASGAAGARQILQGLIAAPLLAAGAGEADHRAIVRDELRSRPYWLLHDTAESLQRS